MSSKRSKIKQIVLDNFEQNKLQKIRLTQPKGDEQPVKEIIIRPVILNSGHRLQFVLKEATRDITKNYTINESLRHIESHLQNDFKNLSAVTTTHVFQYDSVRERLMSSANQQKTDTNFNHDKEKSHPISAIRPYLKALGVTSESGKVKSNKQAKYKQINQYINILSPILNSVDIPERFKVLDMGAGKGYLTFALYDHLVSSGKKPLIEGVEMRDSLVNKANEIARDCGYSELSFVTGSIGQMTYDKMDVLIALHACDTATDDAIIAGINHHAQLIVCSPCCHKQVRKDMKTTSILSEITKYGILQERQAEILTDTIRVMILNYLGYKTKIIEFVSSEHTPKNLLLVGIKDGRRKDEKILGEIEKLKNQFGLERHYLEKIL